MLRFFLIRLLFILLLWLCYFFVLIDNERDHALQSVIGKIKATENSIETVTNLRSAIAMADFRANKNLEELLSDIFLKLPWFIGASYVVNGELRAFFGREGYDLPWEEFKFKNQTNGYPSICKKLSDGSLCIIYDPNVMISDWAIIGSVEIKNHKIINTSLSWKKVIDDLWVWIIISLVSFLLIGLLLADLVALFYGALLFFSQFSSGRVCKTEIPVVFLTKQRKQLQEAAIYAIEKEEKKRNAEIEAAKAKERIKGIVLSARQTAHDSLSAWQFLDLIEMDLSKVEAKTFEKQENLFLSINEKITSMGRYRELAEGLLRDLLELEDRKFIKQVIFDVNSFVFSTIDLVRGSYFGTERFNVDLKHTKIPFVDVSISRVFLNIIKNCHEAAPMGHLVYIKSEDHKKGVVVTIGNSGSKLPKNYNSPKNHGLGLIICESILEKHGSKLISMNTHTGVEFSFVLPTEKFLIGV